jgi:hypothetical protein
MLCYQKSERSIIYIQVCEYICGGKFMSKSTRFLSFFCLFSLFPAFFRNILIMLMNKKLSTGYPQLIHRLLNEVHFVVKIAQKIGNFRVVLPPHEASYPQVSCAPHENHTRPHEIYKSLILNKSDPTRKSHEQFWCTSCARVGIYIYHTS